MKNMLQKFEFHKTERKIFIKSVITAIDAVRPKDFYFPGEMHNFWEIVCVVEGAAMATADERVYNLKKGNLLFHKPMEFHRVWSAEGTAPRLFIISFEAESDGMAYFRDRLFTLNDLLLEEFGGINAACRRAIELFDKGDMSEYSWQSNAAAVGLEAFLLRLRGEKETAYREDSRYAAIYRQIVSYLEDACCRSVTVEETARACNLSCSSLKRIFRMFCDKGVIEYHNSIRMRMAVKLLGEGKSISEVSEQLGFSSTSYFHIAFKRATGVSPGRYFGA